MKKTKLPQQIIVTINEENTENEFLNVEKSACAAAEQGIIKRGAIYVLKELVTIEGIAKVMPGK